jgi:signal transduction histidine kinase
MISQATLTKEQLGLVLVFFFYGLAFFSMGMALALETGRIPFLVERRILWPLAVFGLMHGMHEWLEVFLLQWGWNQMTLPGWLRWGRVFWLAASFIPLMVFTIRMFIPESSRNWVFFSSLGIVLLYGTLVLLQGRIDPANWLQRADGLARYLMAVPAGISAGIGLYMLAGRQKTANRPMISRCFAWAALGFSIYGLTQVFVGKTGMFPAIFLNTDLFTALTGLPVQLIRAAMAILITVNLLLAIRFADQEREQRFVEAQKSRLVALEQVQHELETREILRRDLMRHTVIAQEGERTRIARELHDETAQVLTAFSLNLAVLRGSIGKHSQAYGIVDKLSELCRQMSQGIYRLVNDLRPAQLDDLGLNAAIRLLADLEHQRTGLETELEITGGKPRLDPLVETVIFRVAQEALSNVSRHAGVDRARIYLVFEPASVKVQICDQGEGFDTNVDRVPPHGWGLAGMRERVEAVGGKILINSSIGKGTVVEVVIPYPRKTDLVSK